MTLELLAGFRPLSTHHCVTGSLRHIYFYHDHPLSEELLLGIGGGVGFIYWHTQGTLPFLGGRANARGEFEPLVGARTGVKVEVHRTASAQKAERALLATLTAGEPVMLMVDMGFLPYFDFGGAEYHFGGHAVVVCGYDPVTQQVLIADRDGIPHPVALAQLAQARGSTYKPFPPGHAWYTFDFSGKRPPTAAEVRQAIAEQTAGMLRPPIRNLGVAGIRKAARQVLRWPDLPNLMEEAELRAALFNVYIMIDATGGTGGGLFRYMFGRFLTEAAALTGEERFASLGQEWGTLGDRWQSVAETCQRGAEAADPRPVLAEVAPQLRALADLEENAWLRLKAVVTT